MFSKYFSDLQREILKSYRPAARSVTSTSSASSKGKNLRQFKSVFDFLKNHLPFEHALATGKVRNSVQILSKDCDLVFYRKWCDAYLDLTGGYILADDIVAFLNVENEIADGNLRTYLSLTSAMKLLKLSGSNDARDAKADLANGSGEEKSALDAQGVVPLYSIFFSYSSRRALAEVKQAVLTACEKKEFPIEQKPDIFCVLDKGILVRDWEAGGDYRGLITEEDTLMWFYILLMEHIDVQNKGGLPSNLRNLVKSNKVYEEC